MTPELRLDTSGVAAAATRAALLADDLDAISRRAEQAIVPADLPDALTAARTMLRDTAAVLRRTAEGTSEADHSAAQRLRDLHR